MNNKMTKKINTIKNENAVKALRPRLIDGADNRYVVHLGIGKGNKKLKKVNKNKATKGAEFALITDMGNQFTIETESQTIAIFKDHLKYLLEIANGK